MKDMNDMVNDLVADIEEVPTDVPFAYEVWAVGYDEENELTGAAMVLRTFADPDQAVEYAKSVTLAGVVNLAAEEDYADLACENQSISIEVETVVPSDDEDMNMNVGTVYKRRIQIYEDTPEFVELTRKDYEIVEATGFIQIPCCILKDYNKNDEFTALFVDEEQPWPITYKIISKTTDGYYICEFV